MKIQISFQQLTKLFPESKISGTTDVKEYSGISSLERANTGDISFLGNSKYKELVPKSNASLILLPQNYSGEPNHNQVYLYSDSPSEALAKLCKLLEDRLFHKQAPGVHSTAWIDPSACIGRNVSVGAFSFIGKNVSIGDNCIIESHCHIGDFCSLDQQCRLFPGVKLLSHCELGFGVILNAGVVIGSEGYGFEQVEGVHKKIPHLGRVVIEKHVEVGANTCIDRARIEETKIGQGTKIDNLVQVGHNVQVGQNCLIVAQVGIAGSVQFEDGVVVGGQAGFSGHIKIGAGAKIAGQSGITKDVEPGSFLKGNPALPYALSQRISILQKRLPDLFKRFEEPNS